MSRIRNPHVLKNFVLNRLGASNFPRSRASGLLDEVARELMQVYFVRAFLVARARIRQSAFGLGDCVEVIGAYSRAIPIVFTSGSESPTEGTAHG